MGRPAAEAAGHRGLGRRRRHPGAVAAPGDDGRREQRKVAVQAVARRGCLAAGAEAADPAGLPGPAAAE